MADVTMIRGYGFPKGSRMDYAGYGDAQPQSSYLFEKVPGLDGYREVYLPASVRPASYGDMVLPEMDFTEKPTGGLALVAGAAALWFFFLRGR